MSKLICPNCTRPVAGSPFKSWKFKGYAVQRYECKQCNTKFNFYKGDKGSYTIPKAK